MKKFNIQKQAKDKQKAKNRAEKRKKMASSLSFDIDEGAEIEGKMNVHCNPSM